MTKNDLSEFPVRFAGKVRIDGRGCWLWQGYLGPGGYGRYHVGGHHGRMLVAHRWAWERVNGPVPEGLELDHLCRVRHCVNPAHLEAVTRLVNVRRGVVGAVNRERFEARTHCKHGHEMTEENTRLYVLDGYVCRGCRACGRERQRRYLARRAS